MKKHYLIVVLSIVFFSISFYNFRIKNSFILDNDYQAFIKQSVNESDGKLIKKKVLGFSVSNVSPVLSYETEQTRWPILFSLRTSGLFHASHVLLGKFVSPQTTHFIILTLLYSLTIFALYIYCSCYYGRAIALKILLLTSVTPGAFLIGPVFPSKMFVVTSVLFSFVLMKKYEDKSSFKLPVFFIFSTIIKLNYAVTFLPMYVIWSIARKKSFMKPFLIMTISFVLIMAFYSLFPSFHEEFLQRSIESKKGLKDFALAFRHFIDILTNSSSNIMRFINIHSDDSIFSWEYFLIPFFLLTIPFRNFCTDTRVLLLSFTLIFFLITFALNRCLPYYFVHLQSVVFATIIVLVLSIQKLGARFGKQFSTFAYCLLLLLFSAKTVEAHLLVNRHGYDPLINQNSRLEVIGYFKKNNIQKFSYISEDQDVGVFEYFSENHVKPAYYRENEDTSLLQIAENIFRSENSGTVMVNIDNNQVDELQRAAQSYKKKLVLLFKARDDGNKTLTLYQFDNE